MLYVIKSKGSVGKSGKITGQIPTKKEEEEWTI